MTLNISIIIPTLNEEDNIALLAENIAGSDIEVIIVDGGSHDRTVELAEKNNFPILSSTQGRAAQLNLGAAEAKGDILIFLHADTRLPENYKEEVAKILGQRENIAGAFRLSIENPTPAMRFIAACANLRSSLFQLPYGDQAIFVHKKSFIRLNKFPELPIMEDYLFIKEAKKYGRIGLSKKCVKTSARRWSKLGTVRTTLINQLVIIGYYCGVSPRRLASLYRR